jgi:hypothetical protein
MRMSCRLAFLVLALTSLAGCHDPGEVGPVRVPTPAEPAAPPEPTPAPLAIGWTELSGEPAAEGSRARYEHACALARRGHTAEAVAAIEQLLLEDLPAFGPRWARDEALAGARASTEGRRLDARLPAIREAYRQAIAVGIPAMTYRAREPRDANGQPQVPYDDLRLGVYEPAARRFVPAAPAVPQALAGHLDRQADRALVLAGDLVLGEIWLVQARRVDVSIFDLADPGRVVLRAVDVDARHPETDRIRVAVEAALEGDDARVTLQQLGYDPAGTLSVHVTTDGVDLTREHVASAAPHVHVDANGAFVDVPPPAGSWLERGHLRVRDLERPIALGPGHDPLGHPHVARTPDGRWALVFTEVAGCHEVAFTRHVLDRVDLVHGRVTRLSAAPTHAGVALGPDGSVFLDTDGHVVRFPPGSTTPVPDVPFGVRFALPDYDRDCSI